MIDNVRTFVAWLGILGIPSIFAMTMWCIKACVTFGKKLEALMSSQQSQMRSQLLEQYKKYIEQGYIDMDDLDDWEDQYQKYHLLGPNGIMDAKRDALLKLPNIPQNGGN